MGIWGLQALNDFYSIAEVKRVLIGGAALAYCKFEKPRTAPISQRLAFIGLSKMDCHAGDGKPLPTGGNGNLS